MQKKENQNYRDDSENFETNEEQNNMCADENCSDDEPNAGKAHAKAVSFEGKTVKGIKIAYVCALILTLCGAFAAKIATEKAIGSLKVPIESEYATLPGYTSKDSRLFTQKPAEKPTEAANDIKNVPDDRPPVTQEKIDVSVVEKEADKYAVPFEGDYGLPLGTDISKDFSPTVPAYSATMGDWRTHSGVDFAAADGSQVKAVSAGIVSGIYNDTLYGQVVEIDHGNGVAAKYCGFEPDSLEIKLGSEVEKGTLLGYLGKVPCERSEGSHLHFEMTYNGVVQDPIAILGRD